MSNDDMIEGYFDGKKSDLDELPKGSNRSDSYKHGWRNGRDDRKGAPRSSASDLRREATDIAARERAAL
ncbi:hypothetical protein [Rhizobium leguminosarum]|uniref:hypothetical protein n=1 Tax=Rhizobium leguminosarum TaxID=384 RepID=UPI002E10341D|nr:hypothetical protein U8Q02_36965 [Rhizobium leguminosarum]